MAEVHTRFPIVIYPSEDEEGGRFTAHCLNMDLLADDDTIEGSVSNLLTTLEAAIAAAEKYNADPFRSAPKRYMDKLTRAQQLPYELIERIIRQANSRKSSDQSVQWIDVERECDLRQVEELQTV